MSRRLGPAFRRRFARIGSRPHYFANEIWLLACKLRGRRPSLTVLANHYGSDKGTIHGNAHGYSRVYENRFGRWRDEPVTLLEIGIGVDGVGSFGTTVSKRNPGGASMKMWHEFFAAGRIFGMDINDASMLDSERLSTFIGDQGKSEDLLSVTDSIGGLIDLVIDDGSHASCHQQATLDLLFPFVRPGGVYVVEDLHWQPKHIEAVSDRKTFDVLRKLSVDGSLDSPNISDTGATYLREWVADIRFWPGDGKPVKLAILEKRLD